MSARPVMAASAPADGRHWDPGCPPAKAAALVPCSCADGGGQAVPGPSKFLYMLAAGTCTSWGVQSCSLDRFFR
jgi:hypothetical protein